MTCRTCHGSGLIESGDSFHEPVTVVYCECPAGKDAEDRDHISFAILDALEIPVLENVKAVAA